VKAVRKLFPDTGFWEMASLRLFVIPEARARVAALKGAASPLPFPNGAPGLTNGVAALKLQLRLIRPGRPAPEYGFVSIPDLGDRTWRSALLVDGAYAPTGQPRWRAIDEADRTAAQARKAIPAAERVFVFLESYRPPPFPGVIDRERAIRGAEVYARACAACHGAYVEIDGRPRLASFPNWSGDVGTDPARADAFDERLVQAVRASAYRQIVDPAHTGRYAAPPLSGLWASAPYLHNGSVPTLAQFLLLEPRAARFEVGGHRLDLDTVGIAGAVGPDGVYRYPAGYRPWSQPVVIDTARPGLSNAGHVAEVERLSRDDRRDLLEYLKRL
jgi:mono/diheme cytochrome c family protein